MRNLINNLLEKLRKKMLGQVIYLDSTFFRFQHQNDETGEQFAFSPLNSESDKNDKSLVTILSRNCYHEYVQWYPITKKSDLLKAVELQLKSTSLPVLYIIGKVFNGQTPVTYYHLNKLALTVNSWLLIPETSLLSQSFLSETVITYQTLSPINTVFIAKGVSGSSSTLKGGLIQSDQQFAMSTGVVLTNSLILTPTQHANILAVQIKKLYKLPLKGLFNTTKLSSSNPTKFVSKLVLPTLAIVTVYLLLAVQISNLVSQNTKNELSAATKEANDVLNQYNQINRMVVRYKLLSEKLPANADLITVWQVLLPLYQSGVIIKSLRQNQQSFTMQFSAESASQSLQLLIQQPNVINASFVGPVNRQGEFDTATVSMDLISLPNEPLIEESVERMSTSDALADTETPLAAEER